MVYKYDIRCQCFYTAEHKPGLCPNGAIYSVLRDGRIYYVCPDCTFPDDIKIELDSRQDGSANES